MEKEKAFMKIAIEQSIKGMLANEGGPFGAIIVKNGEVIAKGNNKVICNNDPTAHAEVVAIRAACEKLGNFQLDGCILYTSCEPCPMCLGAIYWARPDAVYYACDKIDAAKAGFDDDFIYKELDLKMEDRKIPFKQLMQEEAQEAFSLWKEKMDKTPY